jgi:SAM-dependent methyltransferase
LHRAARFTGSLNNEKRKRRVIDDYRESPKYLNVGGGDFVLRNWRVLDFYHDWYDYDPIFIDFDVDLTKHEDWPIQSNSYDLVYTSHTLEHLSDATVNHTLSEINRILAPDGGLRISVPDIDLAILHYELGNLEWFERIWGSRPALEPPENKLEFYFLYHFATNLARQSFEAIDFAAVRRDFDSLDREAYLNRYTGMIQDDWQVEVPFHRNWFDFEKLRVMLEETGFTAIERRGARQSRHLEFCTVSNDVFDKRPHMSLYVDAAAGRD